MTKKRFVSEAELCDLAKDGRVKAGKTMAEIARELGVSRSVIFHAENTPERSLVKLRIALVERFYDATVSGPFYRIHIRD